MTPSHDPSLRDARRPVAVCCPDKFRGSLTAADAARTMAEGLQAAGFAARELPLADGGEGTLDVLLGACGGTRRVTRVTGPLGTPVDAQWAVLADGTAVIEMARASGLALTDGHNDPIRATTRGTGELIAAAAAAGAPRVLVSVGGSATTDGGLGAVEALAWSLHGLDVTVACDVTTPFIDAAAVFGPQKGAAPIEIRALTFRLRQLAGRYRTVTGVDVTALPGAGAAGGLAGGLAALGATLRPGFDVVAEALGLHTVLANADLVMTGEGALDASSLAGKVVGEVLRLAPPAAARAVVAGRAADGVAGLLDRDVIVETLAARAASQEQAIRQAASLVHRAAADVGHRLRAPAADAAVPSTP